MVIIGGLLLKLKLQLQLQLKLKLMLKLSHRPPWTRAIGGPNYDLIHGKGLSTRCQEGLHELKKFAVRFEEKTYSAATNQSDYLRKISLKMLTLESKSQNPIPPNAPGTK
ncbi:uncharacterized protein LOC131163638 isoform X3 [Malania oleifera]|uniref:uncharacterized protein LOC131163638 isoform X3 n=1 Tax=Malania oleifera TaxID=397392 RepID=UPI0025AEB868|nr:uncharacterized protein LOC131163638 isoform X3 [Malania oleifera]